jgi:MtrB/PioB family decaheme-associated outer membrane protein
MNIGERTFALGVIPFAIRGALLLLSAAPMVAAADEGADEVKALTCPTNYVQAGALNVPTDSTKFGEYNALHESGVYPLLDFQLQGGAAACQNGGTTRWEASGTNLGATSRNIGASVAEQGAWSFGVGYDQLRHYTTDGYTTPFQGGLGDNLFVLSPTFGVINTTVTTANGVITSTSKGAQTLTAAQLSQFHTEDVYSERVNTGLKANYAFDKQWSVGFDYKRLDQSGAKLIGAGTDVYNLTSSGGFNYGGERVAFLMNPTQYQNDTFNLALNWVGNSAYATAAYYASLFHDDFSGVTWSNPFVSGGTGNAPLPPTGTSPGAAFPLTTMSTPPSNQFHQINLTGGYIFSAATKLTGGLSYARNTQDASYAGTYTTLPDTAPELPVASLNGVVINKHADAKLTHRFSPALNFSAGFKYNERSNRTASHTYTFLDLGGEENTVVNIPMSNKRTQFDAALDYRIDQRQRLHVGYEYEHINRWCANALANGAQGELSATNAGYYVVASCVQVPRNTENKLVTTYRIKLNDKLDFNAGYTYADRSADVNPSFYNPMQANNNGFENFGFRAFFDASRRENLFKGGFVWQPTSKLSLGLNGRHAKDDYFDSPLGVQNGDSSSANLDANYSITEDVSFGGYASWQKRTRDLFTATGRNAVAPLTTLWSNAFADRENTLGLNGKQRGLFKGKFELDEDFTYSLGKSKYVTALGQNIVANLSNQGATPNISNDLMQFRLTGTYQLSRASSFSAGYLYQRLKSNDYYYYAFQLGFTPTGLLPTNQQAPNYSVNTVFVAYRYSFR